VNKLYRSRVRNIGMWGLALVLGLGLAAGAAAHFQTLLPSMDIVTAEGDKVVSLDMIFTHPMEQGPVMDMGEPRAFGVLVNGRKQNLLPSLQQAPRKGKAAYRATYQLREPGDHVFYLEPAPYWEPAEGKMIVHYTKVVVHAFGLEQGWDARVDLPVEIVPLARPYGLWTGNAFRGVVLRDGEPVSFAEIEVEYWNADREVDPPSAPFVTQVIQADANGVFTYAMPRAGWWAFAALVEGEEKLTNPNGERVDVELGGLLWVRCEDMR